MEIGFKVPNDEGIKQDNNDDNSFIDETYDANKNKPISRCIYFLFIFDQ